MVIQPLPSFTVPQLASPSPSIGTSFCVYFPLVMQGEPLSPARDTSVARRQVDGVRIGGHRRYSTTGTPPKIDTVASVRPCLGRDLCQLLGGQIVGTEHRNAVRPAPRVIGQQLGRRGDIAGGAGRELTISGVSQKEHPVALDRLNLSERCSP